MVQKQTVAKTGKLSWLGRALIPALMFQAVAIGGAYATGREIIEFGGIYGAYGWAAGVAMAIVGGVFGYLVYETARRHQLFDYRSITKHLIGKLYWLFDVIYIPFAILIIAVLSSATGNILRDTLGINYWVGIAIILLLSAVITLSGTNIIEKFNSIGTVLLMFGYVLFSMIVITTKWDQILEVFSTSNHSLKPDATLLDAFVIGAIYVGLGFVIYPSTLITVRRLRARRESAMAGVLTGGLYVVPWFLTFIALMAFYPSSTVFDAPVPWLVMLQDTSGGIILLYGILVGWTLVSTAVGLIQSIIVRIDTNLVEVKNKSLSTSSKTAIILSALILGAALAHFGIKDLISVGYMVGALALLLVFGLPLVIRGFKYFFPRTNIEVQMTEDESKI